MNSEDLRPAIRQEMKHDRCAVAGMTARGLWIVSHLPRINESLVDGALCSRRMALVAAVVTSVRLSVVLFGFPHCVSTVGEFPQILAIHHIRHVGTPFLMNLMVPIGLRVLIHIVGSHE